MDELSEADTALLQLHEAGWSIGDTAGVGPAGTVWLVYGSKGAWSIKAEGATRAEAWRRAVEQAEASEEVEARERPERNGDQL